MSREIKFRIYNINAFEYFHLLEPGIVGNFNTIGQYTGLKDKNGKEIYEGDIVSWKYGLRRNKPGRYAAVVPPLDLAGWDFIQYDEYSNSNVDVSSLKIIGNIYENPELLERND